MSTYQKYTIIKDRVDIYNDFNNSLLHYIFKYQLDKETLSNKDDIKNHFMFCYRKACDEFIDENIHFINNTELIKYYETYYFHQFYGDNTDITLKKHIDFWDEIFNVENQRNKNMLKILVELYIIYDKTIASNENILDYI